MNRETTPSSDVEDETGPDGLRLGRLVLEGKDPFPGEFRLIREIGFGAFGTVWLAEDLSPLSRQVALKFIRLDTEQARRSLEALRHEAKLLASLSHPHIVAVHAWRQPVGLDSPCLVMQYISGGSLDVRVERGGPLAWDVATRYVADVADGLSALHARSVIHRDIKPANMLHDMEQDEALVTDLGIAARLSDPASIAGTALYMAPEAYEGNVSPALDVYSLAASLFYLVTGSCPFDGKTRAELIRASKIGLSARDPRLAAVPQPLEELLREGLRADPGKRPRLSVFSAALRGALNHLLADRMVGKRGAVARLQLVVSRVQGSEAVPVVKSLAATDNVLRDLRRVPTAPDRVLLYTGERVRLEAVASRRGFVTVFNVGPTGRLNLLYPDQQVAGQQAVVEANRAVLLGEVELTPPAGRERLVGLWTREPLPLRLAEIRSLGDLGQVPGQAEYQTSRDIHRVQEALGRLGVDEQDVVVLELDHRSPGEVH